MVVTTDIEFTRLYDNYFGGTCCIEISFGVFKEVGRLSKFRPMDSKCPKCERGLVSAGYWTKGEYRKIDGKRKLVRRGCWEMKCNSCNYRYNQEV